MSLRLLAVACALLCLTTISIAADRPNIVVILSDDQGWGDVSLHGNTNIRTPNLDAIGRAGARVERFYVCPVCSPTRAEFLTGRYALRTGVTNVTSGGERLNLEETTIADRLRSLGYATGAFGKWHNGTQYPYHPLGRGFQEFYGFTHGHWGHYFSPPLDHNGAAVRGKGFTTNDFTDHAIEFIEKNADRPFFCYLPFNTPHSPMQVPDEDFRRMADRPLELTGTAGENLAFTRTALAMVENLDANVGRVWKKLEELKLTRKTIVLFFCDNGPNSERWNGGLKGKKGSVDEGGIRSPCFIRWEGTIPADTLVKRPCAAIDLYPTLCDLLGTTPDAKNPIDGRSFKPLLMGDDAKWSPRKLYSHWGGRVSACDDRFRLDPTGKLYDLTNDPGQTTDVSQSHPEFTAEFKRSVAAWTDEMKQTRIASRPFTVGYREMPLTTLPPRDGVPQAPIQRSAQAPNCSYFRNWNSTEGYVIWTIDVHAAGKYEVSIEYALPAENVPFELQLTSGASKLEGSIKEPHDPPEYGQAEDRVVRKGESYMKDFRLHSLGTIELAAGPQTLRVQATKVTGKRGLEMGDLRLKLLD